MMPDGVAPLGRRCGEQKGGDHDACGLPRRRVRLRPSADASVPGGLAAADETAQAASRPDAISDTQLG
jgi:hypothetical protein